MWWVSPLHFHDHYLWPPWCPAAYLLRLKYEVSTCLHFSCFVLIYTILAVSPHYTFSPYRLLNHHTPICVFKFALAYNLLVEIEQFTGVLQLEILSSHDIKSPHYAFLILEKSPGHNFLVCGPTSLLANVCFFHFDLVYSKSVYPIW